MTVYRSLYVHLLMPMWGTVNLFICRRAYAIACRSFPRLSSQFSNYFASLETELTNISNEK